MDIPTEVPIMVLPQCILFPRSMLPLHIFEERYRRMLEDILPSNRMFCIGTIRSHHPEKGAKDEIYEILGLGVIRVAIGKPDGTSDLILQGVCRARVIELLDGRPYPFARIRPLANLGESTVEAEALATKVAELVSVRAKLGSEIPEKTLKSLMDIDDPGTLSDLVAYSLLENHHEKQDILETLDLGQRLRKIIHFLHHEIGRLQIIQKLKDGFDHDENKLN